MRVPGLRRGRAGDPDPDDHLPSRLVGAVEAAERAAASLRTLATLVAEHEHSQLTIDRRAIARKARRRQSQTHALLHAAADRARLDVDELLHHSGPYAHQDWGASSWGDEYHAPSGVGSLVAVGTLSLQSPISIVELPFALPNLGTSLFVTHDPRGRTPAHHLAQTFAARALATAPPGSVLAHLLAPAGLPDDLGALSRLPAPLSADGPLTTSPAITAGLDALRAHVRYLDHEVLLRPDDSLIQRWADGTADGVPCRLVFATGLPAKMTADDLRSLWTLARDSSRHGVTVVAVLDDEPLPPDVAVSELAGRVEHVHVDDDGQATWQSAPPGLGSYTRLRCPEPPGERQRSFFEERLGPAVLRDTTTGGSQ